MAKSYLSLLALLVLSQLASVTEAQGSPDNIDVFRWIVPYDGPKEFVATVGQTITFRWQGNHNVFIHPSMSCDLDGAILVGATPGTQYTFLPTDGNPEGNDMFFACEIGNGAHCIAGQSITVTVFDEIRTIPPTTSNTTSGTAGLSGGGTINDFISGTVNTTEPPVVPTPKEPEEPVVANTTETPMEPVPVDTAPVPEEPAPVDPITEPTTNASEADSSQNASGGRVNTIASVVGLVGAFLALALV